MATYQVTLWYGMTRVQFAERYQRKAAANVAYRYAYDTLAGFGKLDTAAGHKVAREVSAWDDLLPIGAQRSCTISNTGYSVIMARTA